MKDEDAAALPGTQQARQAPTCLAALTRARCPSCREPCSAACVACGVCACACVAVLACTLAWARTRCCMAPSNVRPPPSPPHHRGHKGNARAPRSLPAGPGAYLRCRVEDLHSFPFRHGSVSLGLQDLWVLAKLKRTKQKTKAPPSPSDDKALPSSQAACPGQVACVVRGRGGRSKGWVNPFLCSLLRLHCQ